MQTEDVDAIIAQTQRWYTLYKCVLHEFRQRVSIQSWQRRKDGTPHKHTYNMKSDGRECNHCTNQKTLHLMKIDIMRVQTEGVHAIISPL